MQGLYKRTQLSLSLPYILSRKLVPLVPIYLFGRLCAGRPTSSAKLRNHLQWSKRTRVARTSHTCNVFFFRMRLGIYAVCVHSWLSAAPGSLSLKSFAVNMEISFYSNDKHHCCSKSVFLRKYCSIQKRRKQEKYCAFFHWCLPPVSK